MHQNRNRHFIFRNIPDLAMFTSYLSSDSSTYAANKKDNPMLTQTVLVVDDSCTVRTQIQRILQSAGYEVLLAEDGERAIEMLEHKPDLMILDIIMPGMDGYDVLETMKRLDESYSQLPVLFLTSMDNQALRLLGQEYGAYLQKPVDATHLINTIENLSNSVNQNA